MANISGTPEPVNLPIEIQTIPIGSICLDGSTQTREAMDQGAIKDFARAYRNNVPLPPIVLFWDGTEYNVGDGSHRLRARIEAGFDDVQAIVHNGTRDDAHYFNCAASKDQLGVRRTPEDVKKAVNAALLLHPEKSDHELADHCGCSQPYVTKIRATDNRYQSDTRTGKDGRTYKVRKTRLDNHGTPIPEPLRSTWERNNRALQKHANDLIDLNNRAVKLHKDAETLRLTFSSLGKNTPELLAQFSNYLLGTNRGDYRLDHIEHARRQVFDGVCPRCDGSCREPGSSDPPLRCRGCDGKGLVNAKLYQHLLDQKKKDEALEAEVGLTEEDKRKADEAAGELAEQEKQEQRDRMARIQADEACPPPGDLALQALDQEPTSFEQDRAARPDDRS